MRLIRSYNLIRFMDLLRPYRGRVALIAVTSVATMLGWLALPILARGMVASAIAGVSSVFSLSNILQIVGALSVLTVATYATVFLSFEIGARVAADIRTRYLGHLVDLPLAVHRDWKSGDFIERLVSSVAEVERFVGTSLMIIFGGAMLLLGSTVMMVTLSWKLSLILFVSMPLLSMGTRRVTAASGRAMKSSSESASLVTSLFHEVLHGIEIVKSFNARVFEHTRLAARQSELLQRQRKLALRSALVEPVVLSSIVALVIILLLYGYWEMSQERLRPEDFVAFLSYAAFLVPQSRAISMLSLGWQQFQNAQVRLEEVFAIPVEKDTDQGLRLPASPAGSIEFRDVWFSYDQRKPVFRGLNLRVQPGECVGIVGVSGAGKTTLFHLLLRLYVPQRGAILVDGHDVSSLALQSLRGSIAVVPQDIILFDGTVSENVFYGRPDATAADVHAACVAAQADEFIQRLPAGYDTRVGERGVQLSVGQRQRLAVARALLKDAPILVLDEATSSLDGQTERKLRDAIDLAAKGRTTMIIAHRLSTVMHLPRIIVLHNGTLLDDGPHDTLLQRCEFYRMLVSTQLLRAGSDTPADRYGVTTKDTELEAGSMLEQAPRRTGPNAPGGSPPSE